eukprot:TRINITY_DN1891_c0_g1_i2.p1 TRINITY_DN1891_c0_g1~~TRINITY_DN1891_c0_g1_i2.p1  ORF type:complete len:314 (+),score=43.19 TRINITY_DN1891_c0_g1_i2:45-986(+)
MSTQLSTPLHELSLLANNEVMFEVDCSEDNQEGEEQHEQELEHEEQEECLINFQDYQDDYSEQLMKDPEDYSDKLMEDKAYFESQNCSDKLQINIIAQTIYADFELPPLEHTTSVCQDQSLYLRLRFDASYTNSATAPKVDVYHRRAGYAISRCTKTFQLKRVIESFLDSYWRPQQTQSTSVMEPPSAPTFNPLLEDLVELGFDRTLGIATLKYTDTVNSAVDFMLSSEHCSFLFDDLGVDVTVQTPEPVISPVTEKGLLVDVFDYALQRLKTLNDYCLCCDCQLSNRSGQNAPPTICDNVLCRFFFERIKIV